MSSATGLTENLTFEASILKYLIMPLIDFHLNLWSEERKEDFTYQKFRTLTGIQNLNPANKPDTRPNNKKTRGLLVKNVSVSITVRSSVEGLILREQRFV